jgi:hypothetical protein
MPFILRIPHIPLHHTLILTPNFADPCIQIDVVRGGITGRISARNPPMRTPKIV